MNTKLSLLLIACAIILLSGIKTCSAADTTTINIESKFAIEEWQKTCIGDYLIRNVTVTTCQNWTGDCNETVITQKVKCDFGCSQDEFGEIDCARSPFTRYILIAIFGFALLLFALYLLRKIA